jgi:ATP-dependent Lon protease
MLLPAEVPVMTLSNAILFPQAMLPLYIFEPRYRKMLSDVLEGERVFCIAMQKPGTSRETPSHIAGLGLVRAAVTNSDGTSHVILQGLSRVELGRAKKYKPYRVHPVSGLSTTGHDSVAVDALTVKVLDLVAERFQKSGSFPPQIAQAFEKLDELEDPKAPKMNPAESIVKYLTKVQNPDHLADLVSFTMLGKASQRQTILETVNLETRLKFLIHFLMAENSRDNQHWGKK